MASQFNPPLDPGVIDPGTDKVKVRLHTGSTKDPAVLSAGVIGVSYTTAAEAATRAASSRSDADLLADLREAAGAHSAAESEYRRLTVESESAAMAVSYAADELDVAKRAYIARMLAGA